MSKAVRFDDYGGIEVLEVRDVARPEPGPDQVLVAVRAAGINPSEAKIRAGLVREIFPATFPSGEGSDLAGVVEEVGAGVRRVAVGDEVVREIVGERNARHRAAVGSGREQFVRDDLATIGIDHLAFLVAIGVAVGENHRRHSPVVVAARDRFGHALNRGERDQRQVHENDVHGGRDEEQRQRGHAFGHLLRRQQQHDQPRRKQRFGEFRAAIRNPAAL